MRLGLKLSLCMFGIAVTFGIVGWRSMVATDAVRIRVDQVRGGDVRELMTAVNMLAPLGQHQQAVRQLLEAFRGGPSAAPGTAGSGEAVEKALVAFAEQLDASQRAVEAARRTLGAPTAAGPRGEISPWHERLSAEIGVHRALVGQLIALVRSDPDAARPALEERVARHYVDVLQPLITGYQDVAERELGNALGVVSGALTETDRDTALLTVLALALALVLGLLTSRAIADPIVALREAADRLGAGDLTVRVPGRSSDELGRIAADFNGMAERLQSTTLSKSYVDDIFQSMGDILVVTDLGGRVQRVNRAALEQLGWGERELVGGDVGRVIREDGVGGAEMVSRGGATLPVACTQAALHDRAGRPQGRVWVARDASRQRQVEEELRGSVAHKDALLREVHHRVKNNLQVISSLLRLQAAGATSPHAARLFAESESRIHSMALIHEQLCRSGDHTRIDFRDYVEGLVRNVLASAGEAERPVRVAIDVDPVPLDLDVAIACGLILNELVSNALKYAFPDGRSGVINVSFRCTDGSATLVVADDGVGLSLAQSDHESASSLGLRLVAALVRQLHGHSIVEGGGGTRFTVTFRLDGEPAAAVA
jgi:two-component sensor histidine kinase/HAMP domain-containing protein